MEGGLRPQLFLTQSFRTPPTLTVPRAIPNTTLRSAAGLGPANSNSPDLGTLCCELSHSATSVTSPSALREPGQRDTPALSVLSCRGGLPGGGPCSCEWSIWMGEDSLLFRLGDSEAPPSSI